MAEPVEVAELEHQTLGVRQRAQRDADEVGLDASQCFFVGAVGRLALVVVVEHEVPVSSAAADGVDRPVAGDRQQPGGGRAALGRVAVAMAPERHEGLLRHVLRGAAIVQDAKREPVDGACVPVVHETERCRVIGQEPAHEVAVFTRVKQGALVSMIEVPPLIQVPLTVDPQSSPSLLGALALGSEIVDP